ncbi:MAG: hypothetical protein WC973_03550 [Candidatus Dojkabacteria bacterium]
MNFINACDPFKQSKFEDITEIKIYGKKEDASRAIILNKEYIYSAYTEKGYLRLTLELQDGIQDLLNELDSMSKDVISINCGSFHGEYITIFNIVDTYLLDYIYPSYAVITFDARENDWTKLSFDVKAEKATYFNVIG